MLYVGAILESLGSTDYFGTKTMNFGGKLQGANYNSSRAIEAGLHNSNNVFTQPCLVDTWNSCFVCATTVAFPSEGKSKNDDGKYGQGRCDDGPYFEAQINK